MHVFPVYVANPKSPLYVRVTERGRHFARSLVQVFMQVAVVAKNVKGCPENGDSELRSSKASVP
jgi:hypothetical protein